MGANFEVVEFDGNLTRDQLTNKYQELVQDQDCTSTAKMTRVTSGSSAAGVQVEIHD